MGRVAGKVALISGGRGQGAEEASLFRAEGATVFLTDVLDEVGEKLAAEVGGTYLHLDVTSEDEWVSVANLVLFLASDESSFCTGAEFVVDGGATAGP